VEKVRKGETTMRFRLTEEDLNRGRLLEPGIWYNCEILKVYDTPSRTGDSLNTNVDCQVIDGPFKGAMVYVRFNEKAPGFVVPFLQALGVEVKPGEEYDLKATEGRKIRIFIQHREYNGKYYNDPVDYRPIA
jgi:hypothetical protein